MTGAERTRRYRQRKWERETAERVADDLSRLPEGVDPRTAEPIVRAWRGRGLRYAITPGQWSAAFGLRAAAVPEVVEAIRTAPSSPAPASAVWRALMDRLQDLRAQVVTTVRDAIRPPRTAHALRLTDHPDTCATCGRPPSVRYHDGSWGFPCTHAPVRTSAAPPPPPAPRYPPEDSPGMRAWRAVGDVLRQYPKDPPRRRP